MKSVAFYTLGCKLNFSETSTIARKFTEGGYAINDFEQGADIYVINTCSVTDHADRKCKLVVKEALKLNPNGKVVVIGCYAQLKPLEIVKIPGVNLVLGAAEKFDILRYLDNINIEPSNIEHLNEEQQISGNNQQLTISNPTSCEPAIFNSHITEANTFYSSYSVSDRTRSFLKVQDGCNYFCAFCTIPLARGKSRSGTIGEIVANANEIAEKGIKEIVLTGVNIGDFRNEQGEDFYQLVKALDKVEGIERFRISSIEPNLLTNEIVEFVSSSKKFVPHFHIPLQSGSDKILELMRRRYLSDLYENRINRIKELMPDCCIGVDVIVGFPSETDEDFMETYHFIHSLPVSYLHVFPYSERPNTTALRIKGRVPERVRKERLHMLQSLSAKKKQYFYEQQAGKENEVLWEIEKQDAYMQGFTANYLKIKTLYDPSKVNTLEKIIIPDEVTGDGFVMGNNQVVNGSI